MINYKIHYTGEKIDELLDIVNGNINIKAIRTDAQQLSDSQKAQARQNIGAIDETRAGQIDEKVKETQELLAPVQETYIASKDYSIGEFLVLENKLYKVVDSIDSGETIVVDGNVIEASIGNEIVGINERIDDVEDAILAKREESAVATKNYLVGELLILEDVLYRVTANIASGEAIVVGTNVVATSVAEELAALDEKKANTSGVYDGLTSGQAKQLMAIVGTEDKEPYLFRSSGGSIDVGDRKEEEFVGGTVAWNQLLDPTQYDASDTDLVDGIKFINNGNGSVTIIVDDGGATATRTFKLYTNAWTFPDHIIYGGIMPADISICNSYSSGTGTVFSNKIYKNNRLMSGQFRPGLRVFSGCAAGTYTVYPVMYDITQMFGTTIADYIYSLETSTPGAGVAWFRKLFPKAYYPYDAGTLRSVQFSAHETIGFNAFNPSTGTAKLLGGNQYQISGTYTSLAYENLDGESETITPDGNGHFTPEKNGVLTVTGGNGSNTCVHLVWSGYRDGEWEAFEKHEYEVEEVELRGIPKLDGNGKLYWDGDRYKSDGTVERRYGIVDLGAVTWGYSSARAFFSTSLPAVRPARTSSEKTTWALLNNGRYTFEASTYVVNNSSTYDKCIAINHQKYLFVSDSAYTDAATFKASMSGVYLVYELETPTTEAASPYTNPQIINDFGTEEFLDTREVPIPVGHETFYAANLRDKLQHLPDLASSNGRYLISQNGTQMELVAPQTDSTLSVEGEFADAKATGDAINKTREMIAGREASTTATQNYSVGDLVIVSDTLYRVTAAIATGETIIEGTNVVSTTAADELAALNEEKADRVGEAPDLTAGNARQLLSTVGITEQVPYNFRTSAGALDIGDRETDEIVGGTVVWNQIVQNGNFVDKSAWDTLIITYDVENNTAILHFATTTNIGMKRIGQVFNFTQNHKYLISFDARSTLPQEILSYAGPSGATISQYRLQLDGSTNYTTTAHIVDAKATASSTFVIGINTAISEAVDIYLKNVIIIDLTQMFGTAIADYVYSLDQSTPGAGVAWFRRLFPSDYYAYDAGTLRSVKTSAHWMIGFNQWDEEWEVGGLNTNTGANNTLTDRIRSKNYIRVIQNKDYYIRSNNYYLGVICFYDFNKQYLGHISSKKDTSITIPNNVEYMRFALGSDYGTTYKNDICINFHYDGERDGEYEPYEAHTYALDPIELRGVPRIDGNGSLYWEGDRYKSDGTVERRYAIVDMGTLTWTKGGTYNNLFYHQFTNIAKPANDNVIGKIVCAKYVATTYNALNVDDATTGISVRTSDGTVRVKDTAYSTAADFKAAMSGVYLVYQRATPTTETAAPYANPQIVDNWGTEEYIDADVVSGDRDVAIPVGHVTEYLQDLRSKVETMPNSPDADGDYIVRRTNGENVYAPFSEPEAQKALSEIEILAQIADGVYQGVDLTTKFASEISGDPWAWIQGRIQSGDFSGIHVNDWIPFTTTESTPRTYKACVGGINTYKGYGDTAIGNHIDFICRELWPTRHPINPVNYNNGLIPVETLTGDGTTTEFTLTKEMNGIASVTQGGEGLTGYSYDASTFTLTFAEAPTAGTITVTGTGTEYPWLASDLYLFLNSLAGQVPNSTALNPAVKHVDYTEGGVYYYLPDALKAVIVEKRAYLPKRYSASGLLSDDNSGDWENIGKLWLPSEWEVYGGPARGGLRDYSVQGNCIQYPIFQSMVNRVKNRSGIRANWWLLSASSDDTTRWCNISNYGVSTDYYTSFAYSVTVICFRIS